MVKNWIRVFYISLGFLVLFLLGSCGEEQASQLDNAPKLGVQVDATAVVTDGGNSTTVDVLQLICDATTTPVTVEDFFDAFAEVTFTSTTLSTMNVTPQTLYINTYTVEYIPLLTGGTFIPPSLPSIGFGTSIVLRPDSSLTATVVSVPISTKDVFVNNACTIDPQSGAVSCPQGLYELRFTFRGMSEFHDEFSITVDAEALFAPYDNCSSGA